MIKMMVTVVFVFTLCWLPFNILWIVQEQVSNKVMPYLWFALHWLAMSHACYNPIIYCYMNSRYRLSFIQALAVIPVCRNCVPLVMYHPHTSTTGVRLKSLERTDSTFLQRNNTCTTYISMRRKNDTKTRANLHTEAPIRSASLMRSFSNHQKLIRRNGHTFHISEEQL